MQDGGESGASVLGIEVDGIGPERLESKLGCAEAELPLDREAVRLQQLRKHLSEQVRLTKRLGRDHDRLGPRKAGKSQAGQRQNCETAFHRSLTRARSSSSVTYGVAGAASSSAGLAACSTRPARITTTRSPRSKASLRS